MPDEKTSAVHQPGEVAEGGVIEALGVTIDETDRSEFQASLERISELEKAADAKAAHVQLH
jgi:hypothetical protein